MTRVMVIGLDGATFDLLDRMGKKRPTIFDEVKERGCHGVLETIFPPLTAPAWISLQVGKNPGKHGVYDFFKYESLGEGNINVVSADDIQGKTFYETLVKDGKKCTIIQMPISYPPRIEGVMITGFFSGEKGFVFPKSLEKELDFSRYNYYLLEEITKGALKDAPIHEQFEHLRGVVRERFNIGKQLLKREWDFYFYMFAVTDHISHILYHKIMSGADDKDTKSALAILHDIEGYIREMLEIVDDDVDIIFMSDHGFDTYKNRFLINTWLHRNGYLKEGREEEGKDVVRSKVRKEKKTTLRRLPILINKVPGLRRVAMHLYRAFENRLPFKVDARLNIDFEESLAYCPGFSIRGIFLNDERFHGKVTGDEAEALKKEIVEKLRKEEVFDKVLAKEDFYHGDGMTYAPDILLFEKENWVSPDFLSSAPLGPMLKNNHGTDGIFLALGPNFKKGKDLKRMSIMDVAPTILHMFGLPIFKEMDGKVLTDMFSPDSEYAGRDVKKVAEGHIEKKDFERSKEEEDLIKDRLKGLGYLG